MRSRARRPPHRARARRPARRGGTAACRPASPAARPAWPAPPAGPGAGARSAARSAGRTNTSKETCELTGLPGSVTTGDAVVSRPAPCGPPGCIADLDELHPAPGERVLDHLVGPGADPARGEHQVARRPAGRQGRRERPRRRRARTAAARPRPPASRDRGRQHRPVRLVDLPVPQRAARATSSEPVDSTSTRGRRRTGSVRGADRGGHPDPRRGEHGAGLRARTVPAAASSPATPDVLAGRRGRLDAHPVVAAVGRAPPARRRPRRPASARRS